MSEIDSKSESDSRAFPNTDLFDVCEGAPYVRYGYDDDDGGLKQYLDLHSVHAEPPSDAKYISGVYYLTPSQEDWLHNTDEGYHRQTVVNDIQEACEDKDRVRYPIFIEADEGSLYNALLNARRRRGGVDRLQRHGVRDDFSTAEDAVATSTGGC